MRAKTRKNSTDWIDNVYPTKAIPLIFMFTVVRPTNNLGKKKVKKLEAVINVCI